MVFRFLASMPLGLALFALVGLASMVGSVVPDWSDALYGSWWFAVLVGALVLNTGFCTVRQIPLLLNGSFRQKILFAVHTSVLLTALGCFWGNFAFTSQAVTVSPGQTFPVEDELWTLQGVRVDYYPDGSVSDWLSTVQTPRGQQIIAVNQPAEWADSKVLQSGYSRDYHVTLAADGQSSTFELPQDTEAPLTADGTINFALSPPQAGSLAGAQNDPSIVRTVDLLLISQGKILQRSALFEGVPLELGDTGLVINVESSHETSTFLLRRTPGLWLVWLGLALMAASVSVLVLLPRKTQETSRV